MSLLLFSSDLDRFWRSPSPASSFECSRFRWSFFSFSLARSALSTARSPRSPRSRLDLRLEEAEDEADELFPEYSYWPPLAALSLLDAAFAGGGGGGSSDFGRLLLLSGWRSRSRAEAVRDG